MPDRLRGLWDFDDLDGTERRLRDVLEPEPGPARAEVLTHLARVEGLRGRFEMCARLLDEADAAAGSDAIARARVLLERGRMLRSSGDARAALPHFENAFEVALGAGADALAADAAHMAALAAPDREGELAWTERGVELAGSSADAEARYWLGPLWNNHGWRLYGAAEHEGALDAFRRALAAREADPARPYEAEIARYAVGRTLRALGRAAEAAALLEQAVAWTQARGAPDGWFHEELAEDYAALGRDEEAREQARAALPLLLDADPALSGDEARLARLRGLAGATTPA